MSDVPLDRRPSPDDQLQVTEEINALLARERSQLQTRTAAFRPRSGGWQLPAAVNAGALVLLAALIGGLVWWYASAQDQYVLQAVSAAPKGADIVAALLAEAQSTLDKKAGEVKGLASEAADLDRQLAALGPGQDAERKQLEEKRAAVQEKLGQAQKEQEALTRQVALQTKNLEAAKAADAGSAGSASDNPLAELQQQQELAKMLEQNQRAAWSAVASAVQGQRWDQALAEAQRAEGLAAKTGVSSQVALLTAVQALVRAVRDGTADARPVPVAAAPPAPAPVKAPVVTAPAGAPKTGISEEAAAKINDLAGQLKTATDRLTSLDQLSRESAVQVQSILQSLNTSLGTSPKTAAVTPETLTIRLKELQTVAAQVQDYQVLVKKQAGELEALRAASPAAAPAAAPPAPAVAPQLTAALGSFDRLLAVTMPGQGGPTTAENLTARIDALQKKLLQGQDGGALVQQQAAALTQAQGQLREVTADRDQLAAAVTAYADAGKVYQAKAAVWGNAASSTDREQLRKTFAALQDLFKQNETLARQFPDYTVFLATLVENLINTEAARVKAMAEDQLLAVMASTSAKLGDEQVRVLARTDNTKENTTAVLTSLIREIDQVTGLILKDRNGKQLPRALGSVITVNKPTVTVRRAARFELIRIRRVFLSRMLATGDRIPIAEAEIVASSGEDLFLKITSTIAPSIFPERNDLVFVEM